MGGFLQRGILIYLFIAIAISFAAPSVVFKDGSPASSTVLSWFNVNYDQTNNTMSIRENMSSNVGGATDSFTTPTSPAGANGILGFLDPVFQVFSWVKLAFNILFSPIILLTDPGVNMPTPIVLIFAVPLVLLMIFGLITWIRSGMA